jgi:hypothetical protein
MRNKPERLGSFGLQTRSRMTFRRTGSKDRLPQATEKFDQLAVEAVIGEPVSASYFPVSRENTGKFV